MVDVSVPLERRRLTVRLAGYALPAIAVLFVIGFSILLPDIFPTMLTLETLVRTESVSGIIAIALLFTLIVGEFDVSCASVLGLAAILVTGFTSLDGMPLGLAIVLAIVICGFVGFVNGFMVAYIGISALVATLGMSVIVTGAVFWYSGGNVFYNNIPPALPALARGSLLGIPLPAVFLAAVALVAWYVLEATPLGRYLYAIGGSKDAARLSGLNVNWLTLMTFVATGMLSGVAGILQAAQLGSGNPNIGPPFLLPAFAAAFLGATAFRVGVFNVPGTVLAVFTVAAGITGLQLMGVEFFVAPIFQGLALIIAVIAARYLSGERT